MKKIGFSLFFGAALLWLFTHRGISEPPEDHSFQLTQNELLHRAEVEAKSFKKPAPDFSAVALSLYSGENPSQREVMNDSIAPHRVAIVRGFVTMRDNSPLSGVVVRNPANPETGFTLSADDGSFSLAVNSD